MDRRPTAGAGRAVGAAGRWAWTLWGAIQHGVSDVDHDFWDFAIERFELSRAAAYEPRLSALLDDAAEPGVPTT